MTKHLLLPLLNTAIVRIGVLSNFAFPTFFVLSGAVLGDGLGYQLPPDGTWVKYKITVQKYEAWNTRYDEKKGWILEKELDPTAKELAEETNSLLVRSVGRQVRDGEPCRWIEIVQNANEEGGTRRRSCTATRAS